MHQFRSNAALVGDDAAIDDPAEFREDLSREDNSLNVVTAGASTVLDGLVITGGHAQPYKCSGRDCPDMTLTLGFNNGGILIDADDVTVKRCRIHHNFAEYGGGGAFVYMADGVRFEDCTFENNGAYNTNGGGGLWADESAVTIERCQFVANWARYYGGGLNIRYSDVMASTCTIQGNRSDYDGGGIYVGSGAVWITDCMVRHNTCERRGGGGYFRDLVEIRGSVFLGNGSGYGGAISLSSARLTLLNSEFYGNVAKVYGGALRASSVNSFVTRNCTFVHNRASHGAFLDAINQSSLQLVISNCIVSNSSQEIYSYLASIMFEYTAMADSSSVLDSADIVWGQGNIEADPCFVDPGCWDDNGTADDPNDDFFVEGDYHLKSQAGRWDETSGSWVADDVTSPCIDGGDPNGPIGYEPFPNGGIVNMGAYGGTARASKSYFAQPLCETVIAGDLNGDCIVDLTDLAILMRHWLETGRR